MAGGGPALKSALNTLLMTLAVAVVMVAAVAGGVAGAESDPWYEDIGKREWFYTYVRTLWEEGVTDGDIRTVRRDGHNHRKCYFYPSEDCTRAQYAMMLAKAFRLQPLDQEPPVFRDVRSDYSFFDKPAFGYIQASARRGMILGYPDGTFRPGSPATREQAFAVLVRALGLQPYAENLSDDDARRILKQYRDRRSISPSLTREIATATRFRIVEGYPDGSLKPTSEMNRAEAATVVYRSCMVRADARPPDFSPDGDGLDDFTTFDIFTLRNRNAVSWNLFITDYGGAILKTMRPSGVREAPPPGVVWDGTSNKGSRLPDGTYYYRAQVSDRQDQVFWSVMKPVVISSKSLRGTASPPVVQPGEEVSVTAYATGGPEAVYVAGPWSGSAPMNGGPSTWRYSLIVPSSALDGDYEIALRAVYRGAERKATARFRVEQIIRLDGALEPNPCRAGQSVSIRATTSSNVVRVEATCARLGMSHLSLAGPSQGGVWSNSFPVPPATQPGRYIVTLEGSSLTKSVSLDLDLDVVVNEDALDSVTFTLTG
ncbi:MAG: S-layer homology domain-containing protein [Ignavibacteriales bacterium]